MKKYILIKSNQMFYDGHGCGDEGETSVSVVYTNEYNDLDLTGKISYTEDNEEVDEDEEHHEQDGYNCEITTYQHLEITKEEYDEYKKIISAYNKLLKRI